MIMPQESCIMKYLVSHSVLSVGTIKLVSYFSATTTFLSTPISLLRCNKTLFVFYLFKQFHCGLQSLQAKSSTDSVIKEKKSS